MLHVDCLEKTHIGIRTDAADDWESPARAFMQVIAGMHIRRWELEGVLKDLAMAAER